MAEHDGVFRKWSRRRYLVEYVAALVLCAAACWVCIPLALAANSHVTRDSLLTVPAVAILGMALVVFRHFRRVDKFLRRLMVECFAVAGAFTLTWTLVYAMFEVAGAPRISMWWVFGGATLVWNLWMLRAARR